MTPISGTDPFLHRMGQYIAQHDIIAPGDRVLVAVSGGVDSMVALHALHQLGYAVEAAHFDHQTRNGASADDAAFVQETCARMGILCHVTSEAVEADAHQAGRSFEDYARERRYAFLCRTARERGGIPVATAHHEDDQAETMLMGLLGMTSGFGLTGIAPVREEQGIRIIRPLLSCSRDSIEAFAESRHLSWREDATNKQACCTRNKVRLELLPILRTYSPHAGTALARLADIMRTDSACLDGIAEKMLGNSPLVLDRKAFRNAHEALQRRMIKVIAQRLGINLTHERTINAIGFSKDVEVRRTVRIGRWCIVACHRRRDVFSTCQTDGSRTTQVRASR
jgi:tRNA(Ile)-lysidine synthase